MDRLSALDAAVAEFDRRLVVIQPEQWSHGTDCDEWTVRELVDHILRTDIANTLLLHGLAWADVRVKLPINSLGMNPLLRYREGAATLTAAFRQPGTFERVYDYPFGSMSRNDLLDHRIFDVTVHAWDLARGLGIDDQLDEELVAIALAGLEPIAERLIASGNLGQGPTGALPNDASPQAQLLDLAGRRPAHIIAARESPRVGTGTAPTG
jgi:uncharacterized protein (TIGR03086 family)